MLTAIGVGIGALILGLLAGSEGITLTSAKNNEISNFSKTCHAPKRPPKFEHGFMHGIDPVTGAILAEFDKLDDPSKIAIN